MIKDQNGRVYEVGQMVVHKGYYDMKFSIVRSVDNDRLVLINPGAMTKKGFRPSYIENPHVYCILDGLLEFFDSDPTWSGFKTIARDLRGGTDLAETHKRLTALQNLHKI